jgi:hypothetical protein
MNFSNPKVLPAYPEPELEPGHDTLELNRENEQGKEIPNRWQHLSLIMLTS